MITTSVGMLQLLGPQQMRARLQSALLIVTFGIQPIAALATGWSAGLFTAPIALRLNALLMIAGAALLLGSRSSLRKWRPDADVGAPPTSSPPSYPNPISPQLPNGRAPAGATKENPMIKLEDTIVINRPVQEVWDFVTDCRNEPKWHVDCIAARNTSPPPLRQGSTQAWAMTYAKGKEANLRVTTLDPGRREQLETVAAPMNVKPTLTYTFEPEGEGTRFTRAMDVRPTGATRLMEPFLQRMMKKNNAGYVQNLKQVLESSALSERP